MSISAGPPAPPGTLPLLRRWTIPWLLSASGFIASLDRAIISPTLPDLDTGIHRGPAAKGVPLSAFARISDREHRKRTPPSPSSSLEAAAR